MLRTWKSNSQLLFRPVFGALILAGLLSAFEFAAYPQKISLDQGWQFLADKSGTIGASEIGRAKGWRKVRVGLSWNAQFEDLRDYMGAAWYRTSLDKPALQNGAHALLQFGAVDYYTEVILNGKQIGAHEGGYTPFTLDITDSLQPGANDLLVRVVDPPVDERENRAKFPGMLYNEVPHGKQDWYVQTGGIWQPVWIEVKPRNYIRNVRVTSKLDGSVTAQVETNVQTGVSNSLRNQLSVRIIDLNGKEVARLRASAAGKLTRAFTGQVRNPKLWRLDQPNLYTIQADLGGDRYIERFGFRQFETRDGKFFLNGQPFYMRAALDQDFYPETIYTPPSKDYVRDQMLKGKHMGLNLLRCHIKVCDPTYLEAADEVGMLVWYEIPSWNSAHHFSAKAGERGEQTFCDMVERDWNHPSIVIQSVVNEGWGVDLDHQIESRQWLLSAFDRAKNFTAPLGRLIVDNSACCSNFHLRTDIEDNHRYNTIPDEYRPFDQWIADFAARPKWNFSPFGDAHPTGKEPLVVSEFGNWGLPRLPKNLPWWFARGFGDRPITVPAGVYDRFNEFKFGTLFKDYGDLAEATQWHQYVSLKHEIEEIRRHSSIQGYVITEFTDINWEANGLMSMWREPKAYADELSKLQQDDAIIARTDKFNYAVGEPIQLKVLLSHYGQGAIRGASLSWRFEGAEKKGQQAIEREAPAGTVASLLKTNLFAPNVLRPERERILFELRAPGGKLIAQNSHELFVYPVFQTDRAPDVVLYDFGENSGAWSQNFARAGFRVRVANIAEQIGNPGLGTVLISRRLDERVTRYLRAGGRALVLADAANALPSNMRLKITTRAGSDLDGNWITNFNWVRTDANSPFNRIAFTKILGFESERVAPRFVIQGINGTNYDDVLSGITYGWLNSNEALAAQMRMGEGRLVITTFRFDEYGTDPYATHLLNSFAVFINQSGPVPKLNLESFSRPLK